jgi:hypothetical protein
MAWRKSRTDTHDGATTRRDRYPDDDETTTVRRDRYPDADVERQRERFGGTNWGAAFFGWLVAVAVAVLLTSIIGAIAAGVGYNSSITQSQAQRQAGTIGLVSAIVLLVVLMIGYYAGGYVAGRMSRFDGGRQGLAVWIIGLVVTIIAVGLGVLFGSQYDVLNRVNLPSVPIPTDTLGWGGIITGIAVLIGTLIAALAGGAVGRRYHGRVDAAGY